ncbi:hypothetical protein AKO1_012696 [Acrasis kona]|uniref:EF-hand domain-containing protein n=1 Tax=Acrasis kona TaxID=1008807 RepID=A0AAW2YWU6_9EUKA
MIDDHSAVDVVYDLFHMHDHDRDDMIRKDELRDVLHQLGLPAQYLTPAYIEAVFELTRTNNTMQVHFKEFILWWNNISSNGFVDLDTKIQGVKNLYMMFDEVRDQDGCVAFDTFLQIYENSEQSKTSPIGGGTQFEEDTKLSYRALARLLQYL